MAYQISVMMSYKMIGGPRFPANTLPYDSSTQLIPFIALVLATSRLSIKRRITTILLGSVAFLLMDLSGIILWQTPPTFSGNEESAIYRLHFLTLELFGHWILPLGIWIIAAKEEIVALLGGILPAHQTKPVQ